MEYTLIYIAGDRKINQIMHAADIFERWKFIGDLNSMRIHTETPQEGYNFQKIKDELKAFLEDELAQYVFYIAISEINQEKYIDSNPYINKKIKAISNGRKWTRFKDLIRIIHQV